MSKKHLHVMIYGDLGRYPLSVVIKKRIISFWSKYLNGNINRLSSSLYRILLDDVLTNNLKIQILQPPKGGQCLSD